MTGKTSGGRILLVGLMVLAVLVVSSCSRYSQRDRARRIKGEKIKVVVVTGGHGFEQGSFYAVFNSFADVQYDKAQQKDPSEIFEDISNWNYDVIVLYNMTQEISVKRQQNFIKLLNRGVGVLSLHHSIAAWQQWDTYRKIIGGKYYLKEQKEGRVVHAASGYKEGLDIDVHVEDRGHPITKGLKDFVIYDETYKNCAFERDNHVLLSTDEPTSDKPLCWVRKYGKARICYIQSGHGLSAHSDMNYRLIVGRAIRWCSWRLN